MFRVDTLEDQIQLLASGSSLMRPDGFATRAPNRDLIVGNQPDGMGVHSLYTVTRGGQPSVFLSGEAIAEAVPGLEATDVNLEGGIAFDNQGNLFFVESESDNIMKFDCETGEVSRSACDLCRSRGLCGLLDGPCRLRRLCGLFGRGLCRLHRARRILRVPAGGDGEGNEPNRNPSRHDCCQTFHRSPLI